jgi:hypothetical protein
MAESRRGSAPRQPQQTPGKPAEPSETTAPAASGEDSAKEVRQSGPPGPAAETRQTTEQRGAERPGNAEAAKSGEAELVPATEKPVYSAHVKETSVYVVTVDNRTGLPTKIERLNEESGERKELSTSEYVQVQTYWGLPMPSILAPTGLSASANPAEVNPLVQAYVRGIIDYYNTYGVAS